MSRPAESIRGELGSALVRGIRRHGPDAVGLVLMGFARLLVGVVALGALLAAGAAAGCEITAAHFVGVTGVAALINLGLAVLRSRE